MSPIFESVEQNFIYEEPKKLFSQRKYTVSSIEKNEFGAEKSQIIIEKTDPKNFYT